MTAIAQDTLTRKRNTGVDLGGRVDKFSCDEAWLTHSTSSIELLSASLIAWLRRQPEASPQTQLGLYSRDLKEKTFDKSPYQMVSWIKTRIRASKPTSFKKKPQKATSGLKHRSGTCLI